MTCRNSTYGDHNRLTHFSRAGSYSGRYTYNGRGERVFKSSNVPGGSGSFAAFSTTWTTFVYDEAGRLLAEQSTDQLGSPSDHYRNYVYLGDIPVAVIDYDNITYRIHADHLGTPRVVTDGTGTRRWTWSFQSNPFGEQLPNQDPENTGTAFTLNLRYPGQYYDAESGLHYNYFRDYEPGIGRYAQSDPIGLNGGTNTYGYADGNPLLFIDPLGLFGRFAGCNPCDPSDANRAANAARAQQALRQAQQYIQPSILEISGAASDFIINYRDMRRANWVNSDWYFHCKANCEAAQRGPSGGASACLISDTREWWDQNIKGDSVSDSMADQAANRYGRTHGANNPGQSCSTLCAPYRPPGLPPQY